MVGKGCIGAHHLAHAHLARSETQAQRSVNIRVVDTIVMQQLDKLRWVQLTHQIGTDPVVTLCQSPAQRNHLSVSRMVGIARRPRSASHHIGLLAVRCQIARRKPVLHRQTVEERLDGRTHLSSSQTCHIIHEVGIVQSTHVCLHGTRLRIHAHESAAQEGLVIADGIERTHQRIDVAMIGKHGHRNLLAEGIVNLFCRASRLLHLSVALALGNAAVQDSLDLLRGQLVAVWRTWLV